MASTYQQSALTETDVDAWTDSADESKEDEYFLTVGTKPNEETMLLLLMNKEIFWPLFHLCTWFVLNVVITLYCKALFSVYNFPYPMIMTAIHMLFTLVGVIGCQFIGLFTPTPIPSDVRRTLLWFSIVFTLNIWLSNATLLAVSVNLHQVVRTVIPLFTMATSYLIFNEKYPLVILPSVLCIVIGVALTVWGDMDFTVFEFLIVLTGCFFSSLKGIITQRTQVGSSQLKSLDLLLHLCPLAVVQLILLSIVMGEMKQLIDEHQISLPLCSHLIVLGCVAFALNFVSFRCAALLNPLTLNVAGNVKQVLTCLLSLSLFGGIFSLTLLIGIFITALGALWYTMEINKVKKRSKETTNNASPKASHSTITVHPTSIDNRSPKAGNVEMFRPQIECDQNKSSRG